MKVTKISAKLGNNKCLILAGDDIISRLEEVIVKTSSKKPERVAIVLGEGSKDTERLVPSLKIPHKIFKIKEAETAKNLASIEKLCGEFSDFGLTRDDLVVAIGGGLVTDTVGFAAAIYHRGLPVIYIPTTLLAQVDAAIGGKTGVNLAQGKNLVGAFHQPLAVLCDSKVLKTLPEREYKSGLGEIAKYCFLVETLKDLGLKKYFSKIGLSDLDPENILEMPEAEQIITCIGIKLFVVSQDEKESGLRVLLNYGHTFGHALEVSGHFDLRHGEAIAIGLIYAAELAHILGRIDEARLKYHYQVLESLNLKTELNIKLKSEELIDFMKRDKKSRKEILFILEGKNGIQSGVAVEEDKLLLALEKIQK